MSKIYLVVGSGGVYQDHQQWTVCALTARPAANRLAKRLAKRGNALLDEYRAYAAAQDRAGKSWLSPSAWLASKRNVPDQELHLPFNGGVSYTVQPIPLRGGRP